MTTAEAVAVCIDCLFAVSSEQYADVQHPAQRKQCSSDLSYFVLCDVVHGVFDVVVGVFVRSLGRQPWNQPFTSVIAAI